LSGRDGFDLVLARHYDSAIARSDAVSLAISGSHGFKIIPSSTNGPDIEGLENIRNVFKNIQEAIKWTNSQTYQNIRSMLDKLLFNQGDYAYSMGVGWRLNLPYVKAANSDMIFVTPEGAMHSLFELDFSKANGYTEGDNTYRTLTFKQHEGDDFTITVKQVANANVDIFSIATQDRILRSGWYSLEYQITMKDGTVYLLNGAGRVTKIIDPSGKNEISFDYHGPLLDHLTDSMGRVVKFDYDNSVIIPRIKKIWIENDAYNREVHYDLHGLGLLRQATDVNGRVSEYDYDFKMLLDGSASCKVNFLKMVAKVVLNAVSYGTLGGLLGDDIVLSGNVGVEAVYLLDRMTAPGQGEIKLDYHTKTLLYGDTEILYFKLFKIKIPKAIKFNGHMFQRILTDRVDVYAYSGGPLVRSTGYDYDMRYHSHGQPFVETTVANDGRQKKIYHYISVAKDRYNWNNNFGVGPFRLEQIVLRSDILPLNSSTEVRDAVTDYLYETMETEYDTDRMSPKQQITKRGSNYSRVTYTHDDWGNVIYTEDSSSVGDRVNRTKTWSYYLGVSGPASEAPWLTTPYSQVSLTRNRYNLPVGKIVANYATTAEGEAVTYLHTYNQYNALGQLISNAQWDGKEWLQTQYEYHPTFGSITKKIDAQNHETEYQYDQYGLPKATIEKSISNAKGETSDIITQTGYDYSSGWKLWQQSPNGFVTQYEYDALGRTTKIIAPDDDAGEKGWNPAQDALDRANNPTTRIQYDDRELSSLVTDAKGAQIKYNFDKFGRLEKIARNYYDQNTKRSKQAITTLGYDAWGNITSITDPNGNDQGPAYKYTTWYTYDVMGRNTAIIYPDATASQDDNPRKTMNFNYTDNVLTTTDENGRKTVAQEDLRGRVIRQTKTVNGDDTWVTTHYFDGLGNEVETILETPARTSQTKKTYNQLNLLARVDSPAELFWVNNQETTLIPYQRFEYNKVGQKIAAIIGTTAGERTTAYQPDELGRVIKTKVAYTDNGQAKQAITETYYDADGNKVKVVDANNTPLPEAERKASSYTYTATDLLATETDPAGNTTSYTYDKAGNRLSMTDPRGNSGKYSGDFTIVYDYDDLNRLVAGHLPKSDGQTEKPLVKLVYDPRGNLLQRVEPDGMVTSYTYAPRNRVATETRSGANKSYVIEHHYDAVGNETQTKDTRGYVTIKDYDELNRLVKVTYPEQEGKVVEQYGYDEFNNRTSFVNGRFVKTNYNYDRYNRLREVTDALGGKTSYHYDTWGNLVQMENALGQVTRYQYDELNRLLQETDPQGFNKRYRYDAVGNRVWSQDPNGTASVYEYQPNQLLKQVTLTNGTATQRLGYSYDEAGYRTEVRNDNVVTKYNMASGSYIPDPFGRIHQESKTFGGKTYAVGYSYDVMGRVTGVKYPTGHAVEYTYNNLGELKGVPGYIDEAPSYDQGGLLVGLKAANGVTTALVYDQNGRLKNLKYANQAAALKEYAYTFDGANNIKTKNGDSYDYDVLNQLLYANLKGSFEVRPEIGEQKIGLTKGDYGGRNSLEFTVAALDVIELDYASGSIGVDLLAPIPVTRIELNPNSVTHRVTAGNLRVYTSNDNSTYTKVEGWQLKKQEKGVLEIVLAQPVTTRYIKVRCLYDERDKQLAKIDQAQFSNTAEQIVKVHYIVNTQIEQYNYDKLGNRINDTLTQRYTSTRQYTYYPNSSRLKSNEKYNFEYDANGNLIQKATVNGDTVWTYQYDLLNRLVQVAKNGVTVASYLYDEFGLRLNKTGLSGKIDYVFDTNGNVVYEQENRDYLEYIYVLGKHFARVDGNLDNSTVKKYFFHTDHLGSTVAVTDETGKQVWSAEYTPFGKQVSQDGELDHAAKFTGKDLVEDTGLYYFNARWYDSELGRFVSEDPAADPNNPNLYVYGRNNPLRFIDPSGFWTYEVELNTGDLMAFAEPGDTLSGMEFYYDKIARDNNWKNLDVIHEGDRFSVKQLSEEGIVRRTEIFEDQMRKFDPDKKTDRKIRTQLHDYANVYSIWARNEQTTAKEALASIMDYGAYLRNYQNMNAYVTDLSLILTGVERLQVQGLTRATTVENTRYMVPFFGGSGFKPENALNPEDNQARHFIGYLLAAKEVGLRAPLGSYVRERGNQDQTQDINLAWAAWHFWETYSYRDNPRVAPYGMAYGVYPLQGAGDWARRNL
jgi:RHS repeat-associated protein